METNNSLFTKSEKFKAEYCCSIVRIGTLTPVDNSDNLVKTMVSGRTIIVNKNDIHTGDIMFYADNETKLKAMFLQINNQFRDYTYNLNSKKVEEKYNNINIAKEQIKYSLDSVKQTDGSTNVPRFVNVPPIHVLENIIKTNTDYIKKNIGFFETNCRVRMIKLRGSFSMGYLFSKEMLAKVFPDVANVDLEPLVGEMFDTVCGHLFVRQYIPKAKKGTSYTPGKGDANKMIKKFDRLVDGEFMFHYDTAPLYKYMSMFEPNQDIVISRKIHGTSAIFANVKVNKPNNTTFIGKILSHILPKKWFNSNKEQYDILYASRRMVLNQYISDNAASKTFYKQNLWKVWYEIIAQYIPQGWTLYCEIVGYSNNDSYIQPEYDYGCEKGKSKLMVYRITTSKPNGSKNEMEVKDVQNWMMKLVENNPVLKDKIMFLDIVYTGKFKDLYTDVPTSDLEEWRNQVLEKMKTDKKFYMEMDEPFCKNKVPAEGIVLRIINDPMVEAFKLKSDAFYNREAKLVDEGVVDMEMEQTSDEDQE